MLKTTQIRWGGRDKDDQTTQIRVGGGRQRRHLEFCSLIVALPHPQRPGLLVPESLRAARSYVWFSVESSERLLKPPGSSLYFQTLHLPSLRLGLREEEEEEERDLINDLKRYGRLAVVWNRHGNRYIPEYKGVVRC